MDYIPFSLGVVLLLIGSAVIWDAGAPRFWNAWGPRFVGPIRDPRRRTRTEIDPVGELLIGVGIVLMGVALLAWEWRLETVTVLVGTVSIIGGMLKNWKYFRELFLFRGAARRRS